MSNELDTSSADPNDVILGERDQALQGVKPNMLSLDIEVDNDGETETRTLHFKPLTVVPMGILRKTRNDQQEQMWQVLEWALPEESLAVCDELPTRKLEEVLNQMQQTSEADLGKSQGSSKSSTSTKGRSKQT